MADNWVDQYIRGLKPKAYNTGPVGVPRSSIPVGLLPLFDPTGTKQAFNMSFNYDPKDIFGIGGPRPSNPTGAKSHNISQPNLITPPDPYADLNNIYKQLLANLATGGVVPPVDIAGIRKQVASKYDPQISSIKREIGETKRNYNENRDILKALYDELENDYRKEVKNIESYYEGQEDAERARMGAISNRINQNYRDTFDEQAATFEKLGIEDALPVATEGQRDDLEYLETLFQGEGESTLRDIAGQERANRDYYNKGATLAEMRSTEELTDLLREFEQYRRMRQGDITDLQAARSSDISALLAQAEQARQQAMAQAQADVFNRLLQVGNFGMDLRRMQLGNQMDMLKLMGQGQGQPQQIGKGITGAENILKTAVPDPNRQRELMGLFQQVLLQQPFREGRFETASGDIVNLTPEQAVQYMLDRAAQAGVSDQEKLALMNAIYAYFGRF